MCLDSNIHAFRAPSLQNVELIQTVITRELFQALHLFFAEHAETIVDLSLGFRCFSSLSPIYFPVLRQLHLSRSVGEPTLLHWRPLWVPKVEMIHFSFYNLTIPAFQTLPIHDPRDAHLRWLWLWICMNESHYVMSIHKEKMGLTLMGKCTDC